MHTQSGAAAPFPCTPIPRRAASASLRTISLDDSEHLFQNHHVSVASLRLLFTFAPECRAASLRNRCSPSPEYPDGRTAIFVSVACLSCLGIALGLDLLLFDARS